MIFKPLLVAVEKGREAEWEQMDRIAECADQRGWAIAGIDNVLVARETYAAAGKDLADSSVEQRCRVARFHWESTARQRDVWIRYTWSAVAKLVDAGWTQERAYDFLKGQVRKTRSEIEAKVKDESRRRPDVVGVAERWVRWASRANDLMMDGTELDIETEDAQVELDGEAALARLIYKRLTEKKIDADIRAFQESLEVE